MTDYSSEDTGKKTGQSSAINTVQNLAKATKPLGFFSLLTKASIFKDMPFACALGAAILKDGLDLALIGSLPGIGTVITILCSIFIGMMMLLAGMGGSRKVVRGAFGRIGMLLGGSIAEFIPGINFFPVQSATVFIIYIMTLVGRERTNK